MPDFEIRTARPHDADAITDLMFRSKASWGYSEAFMEASRADLTATPQRMRDWLFWVADRKDALLGVVVLSEQTDFIELEALFVDPDCQGLGLGGALLEFGIAQAWDRGAVCIRLAADPNAQPFYERYGFRVIGETPSTAIAGRMMPHMELSRTPKD